MLKKTALALYIRSLKDLEELHSSQFNRIYFGAEFCESLIPQKNEIIKISEYSSNREVGLTLVTPWCTNKGINLLKRIFPLLPKKTEVVFNDWGVLKLIKDNGLVPLMGRVLIKAGRSPCIDLDSKKIEFFKSCSLNQSNIQLFLLNEQVNRVELDNPMQGYSFKLNKKIKASFYYPFVYIASGFRCPFSNYTAAKGNERGGSHTCRHECQKESLTTNVKGTTRKIIVKGNAHFYFNDKIPKEINKWNVDRLVYMP